MEIRIQELLVRLAKLEGALLEARGDVDRRQLIALTIAGYEARIEHLRKKVGTKCEEHFLG